MGGAGLHTSLLEAAAWTSDRNRVERASVIDSKGTCGNAEGAMGPTSQLSTIIPRVPQFWTRLRLKLLAMQA